jgi:hypothetical protein
MFCRVRDVQARIKLRPEVAFFHRFVEPDLQGMARHAEAGGTGTVVEPWLERWIRSETWAREDITPLASGRAGAHVFRMMLLRGGASMTRITPVKGGCGEPLARTRASGEAGLLLSAAAFTALATRLAHLVRNAFGCLSRFGGVSRQELSCVPWK